jgi:hypothetical protein
MRDKRGYETIYLMHWFREGTRHRSRILYMFRTPGGVRVGRIALGPETIRQIEAQHPDIEFDWNAVRETQQVIEPAPEFRRRRPRREADESAQAPAAAVPPSTDVAEASSSPGDGRQPVPTPEAPSAPAPARLPVPATIEGQTPDEQITFLLHWYPLICDRLAMRTADPERRDALLALAERLNPASWTDADQITAGLQQAAEALERLSRVMARRRRRSRRPGGDARGSSAPRPPADSSDSGADS